MRQVGSMANVNLAEKFANFLRAEGIDCTVDQEGQGFRIWVHNDDKVPAAKEEFLQFLADPNHVKYQDAETRAEARLDEKLQRDRAARKRVVRMSDRWDRPVAQSCPLTTVLILFSIVVAVITGFDPKHGDPRVDQMWFSLDDSLGPILSGELWRLITPIFLHFGPIHLLYNMFWMRDLGYVIEHHIGTLKYLLMVLVIAIVSNFLQFWYVGPAFGGMSGVVYGLFGYVWIRGSLEAGTGFDLSPQTIVMMLGWFFLCAFGVIPGVANWAHGGGLVMGMAFAAGGSLIRTIRRVR